MDNEVKTFERLFYSSNDYFLFLGYHFQNKKKHDKLYSSDIYFEYSFYNKKVNKYLLFDYFPSTNIYPRMKEIYVFITNENNKIIGLPEYLAYKKYNKAISSPMTEEFLIRFDSMNFEESIMEQLEKIKNILSTDLYKILTTNEWVNIPIPNPRDEY